MENKKMKVAVVGCGAISDIYLKNMTQVFTTNLEVVACCANHYENAVKKAEQYGIEPRTYDEILADPAIDMVVILTPAATHYGLIKKALLAGKHVYTEKVMTLELADAKELLELADSKNLYLGSAPDTFLGAALQTAREQIDGGKIGPVTSFQVTATRDVDRLASMFGFIREPGGGVCFDYGVYYMTALVSLLGPVKQVCAVVKNLNVIRPNTKPDHPEFGKLFAYNNESQVFALVEMESGVWGTFSINGDTVRKDLADFKIYGKEGALQLTDPNYFGGDVVFYPRDYAWGGDSAVVENKFPYTENSRGVGPSEMARAIERGELNRANKAMAYHVLDALTQIIESGKTGRFEPVNSTCQRPQPFTDGCELQA